MSESNGAMQAQALRYQSGFANECSSEALPGALPEGQNNPQRCPYGLYAEQLSGTAFTAPRHNNRRSWLYRIWPSAMHPPFERMDNGRFALLFDDMPATPNRLRWDPFALPAKDGARVDFLDGLVTVAASGDHQAQAGAAIHVYAANASMTRYFYDADGEFLIVPQLGSLNIYTEMGVLHVTPQEIAVIPRGIRFRVDLLDAQARGYVCENFGAPLRLPDLGPIGSNGLANPRDFLVPHAWYEDREEACEMVARFGGNLWRTMLSHSPLDVVAWHGNHAPYKYDLRRFNTMGSISYDHPDPSIFLVLQSLSDTPGVDEIDFVVFPPRWLVAEDTFRPPWFHRNIASEFMGLILGEYDAKADGFMPGGASLHNCMSGHGPDAATFDAASVSDTHTPRKVDHTMAFMFETRRVMRPTVFAMQAAERQENYSDCWSTIRKHFNPDKP